MKSAALFDFDKTIISKDTGFEFIVYALKKNVLRAIVAVILSPFAFLFFSTPKYRFIGNSIFLWVSTCGLSKRETINLRKQFIDNYLESPEVRIYADAISKINTHHNNNDHIVIVSGASKWMIKGIIKKIGVNGITIIGSKEKPILSGMVCNEHCYSINKIKMLKEIVELKSYTKLTGYSDSSSDIPMLSICNTKYLVNPSKNSLLKFKKAFKNNCEVVSWV